MTRLVSLAEEKKQSPWVEGPLTDDLRLNPSLDLIELPVPLAKLHDRSALMTGSEPEVVALWRDPLSRAVRLKALGSEERLALRLVEGLISHDQALLEYGTPEVLGDALRSAVKEGLLMPSRKILRRDPSVYVPECPTPADLIYVDSFTLQWHITHACELHCQHCYADRRMPPLTLAQGEQVLDNLLDFCRERHVRGHVCFTGGNPILSHLFFDLYAAAARRGFSLSILANPTTRAKVARIVEIQKPQFYQVSLEGLEDYNDAIRGPGFYRKVLGFLKILREAGIPSTVMLTLMRDNLDQVLPLARRLEGLVDRFTFNRLCPTGRGADLLHPPKDEYASFLEAYMLEARGNPLLHLKDSFLNIVLEQHGQGYTRGCTGYGCGAAFNFVSLLPNGEAHACRRFPVPIGNLIEQRLGEVYDSPAAEAYRRGTAACDGCRMRSVCGGCLAILHGLGLDVFRDADPYCFIEAPDSPGRALNPRLVERSPVRLGTPRES